MKSLTDKIVVPKTQGLDDELALLELRFNHRLDCISEDSSAVSKRVLLRCGLRRGKNRSWARQFSKLTVLYPLLQAEGLPWVSHTTARDACLSHLFFLVHAFIEDRVLDGQLPLGREEWIVGKLMLMEGLSLLDNVQKDRELFAQAIDTLSWSQPDPRFRRSTMTLDTRKQCDEGAVVIESAVRMASIGAVATFALALQDPKHIEKVRDAYGALVTGLQWADDLEDWREDVRNDDCNLLLERLRLFGADPYNLPDDSTRDGNIGHALLRTGTLSYAVQQARLCFENALALQSEMGCETLVGQIGRRVLDLESAERRLRARINAEIVSCFTLEQESPLIFETVFLSDSPSVD